MSNAFFRDGNTCRVRSAKSRRPRGVSRRQRKRQLGFETLEDRRVMSAESPLASLAGNVNDSIALEVHSLSSNTPEGALAILQQELLWQSLLTATQDATYSSRSIPSDPFVVDQWNLINTGQEVGNPDFQDIFAIPGEDINVAAAWQLGYTGDGVIVGVFEPSGSFETTHPDLEANVHPTLSFDGPIFEVDPSHPTAVTGILGAVADNGIGGTGVAPGVQLVPMSGGGFSAEVTTDGFRFALNNDIDIVNNSWGPEVTRGLDGPSEAEILALRDSVIFGRDGLGVIHVFSSGNDAGADFDFGFQSQGSWDSSTYDGYLSTRYTIGVTGVDHDGFYNNIDGTVTNYPETSASVLVAAPTGSFTVIDIADDTGIGSGIFTTDPTGEAGFNTSDNTGGFPFFDRDFLEDIDYTSRFSGTSASAPMVSGVIALMLEANPNLSWRDVQEILVRSARQNAEFDIPNTLITGSTQNTWIQNQMPVFHDPDEFDPVIDPDVLTMMPTLDPSLDSGIMMMPTLDPLLDSITLSNGNHFRPTPQVLTNAAGYTVSYGKGVYGELIGYAHGVVDAELAVLLAEQWHTKNQNLPNELTFTSFIYPEGGFSFPLPGREISGDDSGGQFVPGGLGGGAGFIGYWEEYYVDEPFEDPDADFSRRGGFISFTVPDTNTMTIENVEVKVTARGDEPQFLDNVRILLVSPEGTHQELNHFFIEADQDEGGPINATPFTFRESPALESVDTDPDNDLVATFSSNRSWGERSDDAIAFDPTTGEPAGGTVTPEGWQLHFENYGATAHEITGIEVVWHGSPIAEANTQRIQGLVGVDDNEDDLFNFSRVILNNEDTDGVVRFGEVTNTIDTSHESMAFNVTVTLRRTSDNVVVAQFVTGADGNYYFDVVPGDYIISIEDPQGRTALDDSLTPAGFIKDYQAEWLITSDFFKVWDYDVNLEVPLEAATNAPFSFSGTAIPSHVKYMNFLLDPGPPVAPQADFSGTVFADINGGDVALPGIGVFGDVNRNGEFDAGEILVSTGADGQYSLTLPVNATTVLNVGVRPPADWTVSNPESGFESFFVESGDTFTDVDFHIQPPSSNSTGDGSPSSGIVLGTVFNDKNGDMSRQADEIGVPNQTVYLDMNNSGANDAGDIVTETNFNGAYVFANVTDGSHFFRLDINPNLGISQTFPFADLPQVATIDAGGTSLAVDFGVTSGGGGPGGVLDYGDLPDVYGTRLVDDGARHPAGIFFLGSMIDSEPNGNPTDDASGDDVTFLPDEDGVVLVGGVLVPDSTGTLLVTASRHGGFLQAWMDFDSIAGFSPSEQVVVNELLDAGMNTVTFAIPETVDNAKVYVRFRYGEYGLGSTGLAEVGEVEDYQFDRAAPIIPVLIEHGPDFDEDVDVDGFDFLTLQRGHGTNGNAVATDGDSNTDGNVDQDDVQDWETAFGDGSNAATVVQTPDFNLDGDADGADLLDWQTGYGIEAEAALADGDGNLDGSVDAQDLALWQSSFGVYGGDSGDHAFPVAATGTTTAAAARFAGVEVAMENPTNNASLVAATTSDAIATRSVLAGIASQVKLRAADAALSFTRPLGRLERLAVDRVVDGAGELADLGLALRDRVVHDLFAERNDNESRLRRGRYGDLDSDDLQSADEQALTHALDEEINWRFS